MVQPQRKSIVLVFLTVFLMSLVVSFQNCGSPKTLSLSGGSAPSNIGIFGAGSHHIKYFGYWPGAVSSEQTIAEQVGHVNFTRSIQFAWNANAQSVVGGTAASQTRDMGIGFLFDYVDYENTQEWNAWINAMKPYENNIVAFLLADEPDNWSSSPSETKAILEARATKIKSAFPNTPTMVNFTPAFIIDPQWQMPQGIDYVSFDCYGPWENCGNTGYAYPLLHAGLKQKLRAGQKIFLINDGFVAEVRRSTNNYLTEDQLVDLANKYTQLAITDTDVIGMMPFMWLSDDSFQGVRDLPRLRSKFTEIGSAIITNSTSHPPTSPTPTPTPSPAPTPAPPVPSPVPNPTNSQAQDSIPPQITFMTGRSAASDNSNIVIDWGATDQGTGVAYYLCSVSGGPWAVCAPPNTYYNMPYGTQQVSVRAVDRAGNISRTATYTWVVDPVISRDSVVL